MGSPGAHFGSKWGSTKGLSEYVASVEKLIIVFIPKFVHLRCLLVNCSIYYAFNIWSHH